MDPSDIARLCTDSCDQYIEYMGAQRRLDRGKGCEEICTEFQIKRGHAIFKAKRPIYDVTGLQLRIGDRTYGEPDVVFDKFDFLTMSMVAYVSDPVMQELKEVRDRLDGMTQKQRDSDSTVLLVSDLLWLVRGTQDYFATFGDRLALPEESMVFTEEDVVYPKDSDPSDEQRRAVMTVLNSPLSYVWGAPGTGKTQFVLSTAILAELRKGRRVAVVAPTNNSIEQVLRGVLSTLEKEDPEGKVVDLKHDILRLGIATSDFIRDYPDVCEVRGIRKMISHTESAISTIRKNLFTKRRRELEESLSFVERYYGGRIGSPEDADMHISRVREIMRIEPDASGYDFNVNRDNHREKVSEVRRFMEASRPETEYSDYRGKTVRELEGELEEQEKELTRLEGMTPMARAATAKILAMTPHKLMSQFGPEQRDAREKLSVDHIFMDEAAYCNTIHALSMFTFGVPVTMLGDHLQLPPVCELDELDLLNDVMDGGVLKDCFVWARSALYAEEMFTGTREDSMYGFTGSAPYRFSETVQCDLTASHRFGENLASILNDCIYHNGIHGVPGNSLEIVCIDTVCGEKTDRSNIAEAKAAEKYLEENLGDIGSFAVLTPYSRQVNLISRILGKRMENRVMTVHKSQGREWDTVILSVADCSTGIPGKGIQLHLTSTAENTGGTYVVNTAVSRAKKRLVLICDRRFWASKKGELIGMMASQADRVIRFDYEG